MVTCSAMATVQQFSHMYSSDHVHGKLSKLHRNGDVNSPNGPLYSCDVITFGHMFTNSNVYSYGIVCSVWPCVLSLFLCTAMTDRQCGH